MLLKLNIVTPATIIYTGGQPQQLVAQGVFSDSSVSIVTNEVNWTSSNQDYATVDNTTTKGLLTPLKAGTTLVAASYLGKVAESTLSINGNVLRYRGGSNRLDSPSSYGQLGGISVPSCTTDNDGNFLLYGGYLNTSYSGVKPSDSIYYNILWLYNLSNITSLSSFTLAGTSDGYAPIPGALAVYGTQGIANSANTPGALATSASWVDASNNLWLFGGLNGTGDSATLNLSSTPKYNHLWLFDRTTKQWTWVKGSNTANATGTYGQLNTPDTANTPGARENSSYIRDNAGNFWLFGGYGYGETGGAVGYLNDLWLFNPATREWQWVAGDKQVNSLSSYGSQYTPATGNKPGGRAGAQVWFDNDGKLWLYGGWGYDENNTLGGLADLWLFDPATREWAWMGGSKLSGQNSIGTVGSSSINNSPGWAYNSLGFVDSQNNLWLFNFNDSTDRTGTWSYNTTTRQWKYLLQGISVFRVASTAFSSGSNSMGRIGFGCIRYNQATNSVLLLPGWFVNATGQSAGDSATIGTIWEYYLP